MCNHHLHCAVGLNHHKVTARLTNRCGINKVVCDGSNVPAFQTCRDLLSSINSSRVLANSPRAIDLIKPQH